MLVLVLILVVIALVLLLAGWFLQVVALAWTSVGISLLAGLALLYDWWQTRSAVRAGDRSENAGAARDASGAPVGATVGVTQDGAGAQARSGPDMEPATQVLPVVRPETGGAGAPGRPAGAVATPPDAGNASEPTIQMPVVRPSGSPEGPPAVSRTGTPSSPSVTESGSPGSGSPAGGPPDRSDEAAVPGPADQEGAGRGGDPVSSGPVAAGGGENTPRGPGADADGSAPDAPGTARHDDVTAATAAGAATAATTGVVAAGAAAATERGRGDDDGYGVGAGDRPEGAPTGDGRAGEPATSASGTPGSAATGSAPEGATTAVPAAAQGPDQDEPAGAGTPQGVEASGPPAGAAAATAGGAGDAPPTGDGPVHGADSHGSAQGAPADAAQDPAPVDGEAPEEPRDPAVANLVARLPDEVLVIDEHPRYHVQTCRMLSGRPVIPLPVSEAVELGFTPCGWCAPNRTLGERHPAQAR